MYSTDAVFQILDSKRKRSEKRIRFCIRVLDFGK